jgi:heme exporter protein D
VRGYSLFQWIALAVTLSGLCVAFLLVLNIVGKLLREWVRRRLP